MEPINYMAMVPQADFAGNFLRGVQAAGGLQDIQLRREAAEQIKKDRADQERQQAQQVYAAQEYNDRLRSALSSGNVQDLIDMSLMYPSQGENLRKYWEATDENTRKNEFAAGQKVLFALDSGKPDVALKAIDDHIAALENGGQDASKLKSIRSAVETNPVAAKQTLGLFLSSVAPKEFAESYSKYTGARSAEAKTQPEVEKLAAEAQKLRAEGKGAEADALLKRIEAQYKPQQVQAGLAKTQAEVQNLVSQATERAGRLALDRQKFYDESDKWKSELGAKLEEMRTKNATLPDDARKLVNENVATAAVAKQDAAQMRDLAGRMREQGSTGSGLGTSAWEWVKGATGNQDYMSGLRQEYARVRASGVISSLPPGPATDRDIAIFSRGFPPENADAQYIAEFLDATARLKDAAAAQAEIKAEWTNSVGSLGRARKDIEVDGVMVPAGTSYLDFQKNYLPRKLKSASEAEKTTSRQEQIKAGNRPYLEGWSNFATGGQ